MNKYFIKIPYSYTQYGELSGIVYAEDEEEAAELTRNIQNIHEDEFEDGDGDSTNYYYDNLDIELEETNVTDDPVRNGQQQFRSIQPQIPSYYLLEINSI